MKYQWRARPDLPETVAHLVHPEAARTLCGMTRTLNARWENEPMLLECRKRCRACERRMKLAKYWMTALLTGPTAGKDGP